MYGYRCETACIQMMQVVFSWSVVGVFDRTRDDSAESWLNHNHRDFTLDNDLKKPYLTVPNVYEAVQAIFKKEGLIS